MIRTRSGFIISNVVISTILGFDGRGIMPLRIISPRYNQLASLVKKSGTTVLGKSFTFLEKRDGFVFWDRRTWKRIQNLDNNGILNAYNLTNRGYLRECPKIIKAQKKIRVIPSISPDFQSEQWSPMEQVSLIVDYMDFNIIELDVSCYNADKNFTKNILRVVHICKNLRNYINRPQLTIIVKIGYNHPYEFAQELEGAGVDAIHAVNAIPWKEVYPCKISPLNEIGGGSVSGGPIKKFSLSYNRILRKKVGLDLIMGGGISSLDDVERFEDIGADAVSMCTVVRHNPEEAMKIIRIKNMGGGK
jgi:dihydroorotate dehydrogenase